MKFDKTISWRPVAIQKIDLAGKRALVVGGTAGIGQAISNSLASCGAHVTVVGRKFRDHFVSNINFVQADLSRMKEAERVANELPAETFDLVVFTVGIIPAPKRQVTAEGLEMDMAISYLSRFVMLRSFGLRLGSKRPSSSAKPRVFIMGFPGVGQVGKLDDLNAEKAYNPLAVHMNTVAGNEMLVIDSATRFPSLNVYGLNPGLIKTDIRKNLLGGWKIFHGLLEWMIGILTPSAQHYAERIVPLLVSADLEAFSGAMFDRKGRSIKPSQGLTDSHVEEFLSGSEALVGKAIQAKSPS